MGKGAFRQGPCFHAGASPRKKRSQASARGQPGNAKSDQAWQFGGQGGLLLVPQYRPRVRPNAIFAQAAACTLLAGKGPPLPMGPGSRRAAKARPSNRSSGGLLRDLIQGGARLLALR